MHDLIWNGQLQGISIGLAMTTLYSDRINTTTPTTTTLQADTKFISWCVACT